jgi:hypothetical protein
LQIRARAIVIPEHAIRIRKTGGIAPHVPNFSTNWKQHGRFTFTKRSPDMHCKGYWIGTQPISMSWKREIYFATNND